MRKIYCDLCGTQIGEVSTHGVEMLGGGSFSLLVGKEEYKEVCPRCYGTVKEFVKGLKKSASV